MNQLHSTLVRIEQLLLSKKTTYTLEEFCAYSGLSKSAAYKLTHRKKIRYSRPNGKKIYITKEDADKYLQSNPILPQDDIEEIATTYVTVNSRKRWDAA